MGLDNPIHIALLLVVILLLFGVKRLPEIGRGLGQGLSEFKGAMARAQDEPDPLSQPSSGTSVAPGRDECTIGAG